MITKKNKEEQSRTMETSSFSLASPIDPYVVDFQPVQEATASSESLELAATPILNRSMVKRALVTFFDNGESAKQRYKIAIKLNFVSDEETPEFIAPVTKDSRAFRRYTAQGTRQDLVEFHDEMRRYVKQQGVDNKPYFGKFHLNHKDWSNGKSKIQVEPYSYACVWYDGEGWTSVIKLYDFIIQFDLFNTNVTANQSKMGVKSTYLWQNPKYEKTQRPLTWAEKRKQK
jgi:hypothetical protein